MSLQLFESCEWNWAERILLPLVLLIWHQHTDAPWWIGAVVCVYALWSVGTALQWTDKSDLLDFPPEHRLMGLMLFAWTCAAMFVTLFTAHSSTPRMAAAAFFAFLVTNMVAVWFERPGDLAPPTNED